MTMIRYTEVMAALNPPTDDYVAVSTRPNIASAPRVLATIAIVVGLGVWPRIVENRFHEASLIHVVRVSLESQSNDEVAIAEPSRSPASKVPGVAVPLAVKSAMSAFFNAPELVSEPIQFVVLSDLHIRQADPETLIPPDVTALIPRIVELEPLFVVVVGDFTSGAENDLFRQRGIERWWQAVHEALLPLRDAGIPVFPIPGNHDVYRDQHQEGYERAWQELEQWIVPFHLAVGDDGQPSGQPPYYYAVDIGGLHLTLLDVSSRTMSEGQLDWLAVDLAGAQSADLRLAFGHLPLQSIMGRRHSNSRLEQRLGPVLRYSPNMARTPTSVDTNTWFGIPSLPSNQTPIGRFAR